MHSIAAVTASSSPSAAVAAALCCRASCTSAALAASSAHRGRRLHQPCRHISRSRRADSPPSVTPHASHGHSHGHHPMVGTTEGVLNLISKLGTNIDHIKSGRAANPHHMPSFSSNSPFPSTTSSAGLARQPVLPSFTPSSPPSPLATGSATSYLPSPPPMARKAEALSKLNAVDLGSGTSRSSSTASSLGQTDTIRLASAMGTFGVAGSNWTSPTAAPALPQYPAQPQEFKIDMSFLERVLKLEDPPVPSASSTLEPATSAVDSKQAAASWVPTFSTATDADWDALFSTTTTASTSSSSTPLAPTQPATAANQLPDLSQLSSHLQSVKSRTSARSSTLSLLSRIPSASTSLSSTSPLLPPRLSTDDLNSLRIHLRASSTSPIHLRAFLATLFTHLPLPPSAIVADAIQAAATLRQPGIAHAIVAQIRRDHGLLGLVTCLSPLAFEHLIALAWHLEGSMPRVVKWMHEMQRVGVKPTPGLAGLLDEMLTQCTAPAAIEAQVGARTPMRLPGFKVPSEREANWLWTVLCEVNWTRYLASARVSLDKASESGSLVRGPRVPRDSRGAGGHAHGLADKQSALFSSQSLADLIRSAGVAGASATGMDDLAGRQAGEHRV